MAIVRTSRGGTATDGDGNATASKAFSGALTNPSLVLATACAWDDNQDGLTTPTATGLTFVAALAEQIAQLGNLTQNVRGRTWYALNTGTTTPTVNYSGGNYWFVDIEEFTGVDATTPLDVVPVASGGISTPSPATCAAGSITPVTNGCLLVAVLVPPLENGSANITAITVPSGFTLLGQSFDWTGTMTGAVAYMVQTTAAAINPTWQVTTTVGDVSWRAYTMAFRPSASSTSPQTWAGSAAHVQVGGTSGSFAGGAVAWAGSIAHVRASGVSGSFTPGVAVWPGSAAHVTAAATSGSFTAGAATWQGSVAHLDARGIAGSFAPGPVTWQGSHAAIAVTAASGSFAGAVVWQGSRAAIAVTAASGPYVSGAVAWSGSSGHVVAVGISGSFSAAGAPQTWAGTRAALEAHGTSGPFAAGPVTWTGSIGHLAIAGAAGSWSAGPVTWPGSAGHLVVLGISGAWSDGTTPVPGGTPAGTASSSTPSASIMAMAATGSVSSIESA